MSLQSATEFTNVIIANPVFMSEVSKAIDGKNEAEISSAISALGKNKGYDFTAEEAATTRHAFVKQLSDADLDGVAGGLDDGGFAQAGITIVASQVAGESGCRVQPASFSVWCLGSTRDPGWSPYS